MLFEITDLLVILPELFVCLMAFALLLVGLFGGKNSPSIVNGCAIVALMPVLYFLIAAPNYVEVAFSGMVISNSFIKAVNALLVIGSALVLVISSDWLSIKEHRNFEYPVLILLSLVGMMVLVSSSNLLSLYMGLELTSLPLYVLASIDRDSPRSNESGLKYFVLGSLASGMMLFGLSLIYGFAGTLSFDVLQAGFLSASHTASLAHAPLAINVGVLMGLLLVMVGFCFKISAVPFHMWTPDVYEGAPTPVTAFFAIAPKIAALTLFARLLNQTFGELVDYWQQVIIFISIASMLVGAFGALKQTNIKRLLAYSSIGHVGYGLIAIASASEAGMKGLLIYLALYLVMSIGAFSCVLLMRRKGVYVEEISELAGLGQTSPCMAFMLSVFMFSMAGIPPLAGFFGKMYVFLAAIQSGLYVLAVVGVLSSVVAAFYYLKLVKLMYFDEPAASFDKANAGALTVVMTAAGMFTLVYFLYPTPLITTAKAAVQALAL